jgi:hypothetical protein
MGTIICKCIVFFMVISSLPIQENKTKVAKVGDKEKLIGVWGKDVNENANFKIVKDSIYYFEDKYHKYILKEHPLKTDSIIIYFDDFTYRGVFYFRNDSLILRDFRESKFVRIK